MCAISKFKNNNLIYIFHISIFEKVTLKYLQVCFYKIIANKNVSPELYFNVSWDNFNVFKYIKI